VDSTGKNTTLNGNISGAGDLTFNGTGNAFTIGLAGDNSGYSGTITFNSTNVVNITSANAGSASAAWAFKDPTIDRVRINIAGGGTINFGSLSDGGVTGGGQIQNDTSSTAVILSVGALNTSTTFSGTMKDGATGGTLALTKVGSGTLTLSGANTYTGATVINQGKLLVNNTHTGAGAYTVASGGTLGGIGAITTSSSAGVTVLAGGKLAPGGSAAAGKLTLNLGSGSLDISGAEAASNSQSLLFRVGTTANSDKVAVTGAFNIGTGTLEFDDFAFTDVGSIQANTTYTLIDASSITGSLGSVVTGTFGNANSVTGTLALDQANGDLLLNVTAAPEPQALGLLVLGGTGMLSRRRRRTSVAASH
jgi:autotransporter-associated beta strand protein